MNLLFKNYIMMHELQLTSDFTRLLIFQKYKIHNLKKKVDE